MDALRQVEQSELVGSAFAPRPEQGRSGATLRRGTQHRRVVFWGALAVALVPFVVSAVTVLVGARGYTSFGDNALTELTVRDVGRHAVEVGVFNRFGWHHLGPALFYVLAPVYRALGSHSFGLLIGALLLNAAAVVGVALVARRRAGVGFAVAALAGATILSNSLGSVFLRSPWTPNLIVLPFMLVVLLSWSLAEGDTVALPWAALVASFIVQMHLAPTLPIVFTLIAGSVLGARRLRSNGLPDPSPAAGPAPGRRVLLAAGVLAAMWFLPFMDVVTHSGGNLQSVVHYFLTTSPSGTLAGGYHVVARQLAIPPPWLGRNPLPHGDLWIGSVAPHGAIPWIGMMLVLGVVAAWRAGQHRALRFGVVVAAALVAEMIGISRIAGPLYHWDLTYVPVTAMLAALAGVYCAWSALPTRTRLARPAAGVLLIGALVVPASMLTVTSSDPARLQDYDGSVGISLVEQKTLRSLRGLKDPVFVRVLDSSPSGYGNVAAMVLVLEQHGVHAVVSDAWHNIFPRSSIHTTGAIGAVVTLLSPSGARLYQRAPGERLVAGDPADRLNARVRGDRLPPGAPVVFVALGLPAGDLRPAVMGPGRIYVGRN